MSCYPFLDPPETEVLTCCHLLADSATLRDVIHVSTDISKWQWQFFCDQPEHDEAQLRTTTLNHMLSLYPEIAELADCPLNCRLKKGFVSGKWYDFHFTTDRDS